MGKNWLIVFAIVLALSALFLVIRYQPVDNARQSMSEFWMFKGAYAAYKGQIGSFSVPCSINETIQVTGLNATHVQIQTNSSIGTFFAPTLSDQTTLWVNKTNINFQPKGETLSGTYSTKIAVKNIGIRDCIAYDYVNVEINATFYIDKVFLWPVRIVYSTVFENQTYLIEFSLKDTNINGLN
jgi:hypothetical protein